MAIGTAKKPSPEHGARQAASVGQFGHITAGPWSHPGGAAQQSAKRRTPLAGGGFGEGRTRPNSLVAVNRGRGGTPARAPGPRGSPRSLEGSSRRRSTG